MSPDKRVYDQSTDLQKIGLKCQHTPDTHTAAAGTGLTQTSGCVTLVLRVSDFTGEDQEKGELVRTTLEALARNKGQKEDGAAV